MLYRIIHSQNKSGPLILDDIEDGQTDPSGSRSTQPTYVPYNFQEFKNKKPVIDKDVAGYINLAPTNDVELSLNNGTLSGLKKQNFVSVVSFNRSDLAAPTVSNVVHDTSTSQTKAFEVDFTISDTADSNTGEYKITINSTEYTYTDSSGTDDADTIASNLAGQIDGDQDGISATASTNVVTVTSAHTEYSFSSSSADSTGSISESITNTGKIVIKGSNFNSVQPRKTLVTVSETASGQTLEFDEDEISSDSNSSLSDTQIILGKTLHNLKADGTEDADEVKVRADRQEVTEGTVTIV